MANQHILNYYNNFCIVDVPYNLPVLILILPTAKVRGLQLYVLYMTKFYHIQDILERRLLSNCSTAIRTITYSMAPDAKIDTHIITVSRNHIIYRCILMILPDNCFFSSSHFIILTVHNLPCSGNPIGGIEQSTSIFP